MRHLPLLRRDRQGYDSGTLIAPARFLFYDSFCEIHSPMKHVSKLILFVDHHGFVKIVTIARFAIFQRKNLQEMTKVGEQWRSTTNLFPVTWPRGRFIGAHVTNYIKSYQKCSFPRLIEHWPQQPRRWIWCVKSNLAWRQRCPRLSWRWRQCSQTWAYLWYYLEVL